MSLPAAWVLCVVVCIRVPWMWFSWVLAPGSRGRSSERVWRVEVDLGYHDKRGLKGLVDRRTTSPVLFGVFVLSFLHSKDPHDEDVE